MLLHQLCIKKAAEGAHGASSLRDAALEDSVILGEGGTGGSREPPGAPVPVLLKAFTSASLGIPPFAEIMPRRVAVGRAHGLRESVPADH